MNPPRPFVQRLEAWLEEGPASAPPDLLDQVLDSIPLTDPPRRRFVAARRLPMLSSFARFGAAVAAILVIGVVGISLMSSRIPGIGAGATPTPAATEAPSVAAGPVLCTPAVLAARITSWQGAAGHRIADVAMTNTGSVPCETKFVDRPELVGGDGTVLIEGAAAPASLDVLGLAAGETVTTLVQDGNYCGATPVAPVTVAFVLSNGAGRVVATPVTPTDVEGIPPCNGAPGSAGTVEMHPWGR